MDAKWDFRRLSERKRMIEASDFDSIGCIKSVG
jgi:hypothetical protein